MGTTVGAADAKRLREEGNVAFRCGDFGGAVRLYSAALDASTRQGGVQTLGVDQAVLLTNRQ